MKSLFRILDIFSQWAVPLWLLRRICGWIQADRGVFKAFRAKRMCAKRPK